jgi:CBS domain containing-hemolysin-like protein
VPIIGGSATAGKPSYSDEEMMALVSAGEAEGDIEQEEKEMIHGVIEFADTVAREVMTPRTDMACIPVQATLLEAARVSEETGFSRLPVYEKDVDHIIGILFAKDMVSALQSDGAHLTAAEMARKPATVIPESKKISEVLQLMQRNRLHMAIVIDEYGGTAGLVTIEDLLEEIFGEIRDEYDVEAEPVRRISQDAYMLNARVSTNEVEDLLGVALPEGDFDSVGGFILDQLGYVPLAGERVVWRNLELTVETVSENRILRVKVVRKPEEAASESEDDKGE